MMAIPTAACTRPVEPDAAVARVDGLGPVPKSIQSSQYSNWEGGIYQSAKASMRNIVLSLQYRPNYAQFDTVQDLRRDLYNWFAPGSEIEMRFITGDTQYDDYRIKGVVETMEPNIFSKDPEVQVSIICPDPYFSSPRNIVTNGQTPNYVDLPEVGTAPSGFQVFVPGHASIRKVTVSNAEDEPIVYVGTVPATHQLCIQTLRGDKRLYARNLANDSIVQKLEGLDSGGLSMTVGGRVRRIWVDTPDLRPLPYVFTYRPRYVGI